jgi:hypothetical protein
MADRLLGTGSAVTDLKRTSDPVFFMDLFRWTYHFDVVVFSDPRMFLQILRADPDADAVIFLRGVTIGVLDPDWIFMLPSGRRHRFSTHAPYIFVRRRDP